MLDLKLYQDVIKLNVQNALAEDIGDGDITAQLIPSKKIRTARVISREEAVICGAPWAEQVFSNIDPNMTIKWLVGDGETVAKNGTIFEAQGAAASLLTAERCALNFLQTLSGTATACRRYADKVKDTGVTLLDTRKTIPGLRIAQKYAVTCGGCSNHRIGLYDAFLIKENHIDACGSIAKAVTTARANHPQKTVEVEVETLDELDQALAVNADIIMLDNFSLDQLAIAVNTAKGKAKLEASGGITDTTLKPIAETGVDFISIGALTKDCKAIDLSMRLVD